MRIRSHASFGLAAIATVVLAASCQGDDEGDIASACQRYSEVFCHQLAECTGGLSELIGDEATCRERFPKSCEAAMGLDGVNTTAADLDACTAAVEAAGCEGQVQALFTQCLPLFKGSKPDGAPCSNGIQCQGGHCDSDGDGELVCGVCETRPGAGQPCPDGGCDYGLLCGEAGTCIEITYAAEGESCDFATATSCQNNLSCVNDVCTARKAQGEACTSSLECTYNLFCDQTVGSCQPDSPPASVGQPCGTDTSGGTYVSCNSEGYCENNVCQAKVADGGSCTSSNQCMLAANCVAGVCSIEPPLCE